MWHLPPNATAIIAFEQRNQTPFSVVGSYLELCITYARRHARAHKDKQAHNRTPAYTQVNVALRMHCACQEPGGPLCGRQPIQNRSSPHIRFTPLRPAHTLNHTTPNQCFERSTLPATGSRKYSATQFMAKLPPSQLHLPRLVLQHEYSSFGNPLHKRRSPYGAHQLTCLYNV